MSSKRTFSYALLGGLSLFLALQGCSDDGDENPTPPDIGEAGSGGSSGSGGSGGKAGSGGKSSGAAGDGGTGNTGNVGGEDPGPVGGAGGAPPQPECDLPELGADGCFNCPQNGEVEQWLNRCLETDCEPFDNSRLPQLEDDGALPPLP